MKVIVGDKDRRYLLADPFCSKCGEAASKVIYPATVEQDLSRSWEEEQVCTRPGTDPVSVRPFWPGEHSWSLRIVGRDVFDRAREDPGPAEVRVKCKAGDEWTTQMRFGVVVGDGKAEEVTE